MPRRSIDGFTPEDAQAFRGLSPSALDRMARFLGWVARRLEVEVEGVDKIPEGRCLLVANHAFGYDMAFPMAEVYRRTGRVVWSLGEHAWWRFPFLRRLATGVGIVDGTADNADRLLSAGEIVLVLPGGLREAMKPRELRYHLLWGHRYGFIRAAIRNAAPIVPLALLGADEIFDLVGNAFQRGRRFGVPLPKPAHGLPIPHRAKLRSVFGDPILLSARPDQATDPQTLRRCRHEVEGALHELIEIELARRLGIDM